ncbi:MAG: MaoC family dehydratase N-terminal domain-containing protein [Chloroflexota bacterium]
MLPKDVTDYIGKSLGTRMFEVERGSIMRFAEAVGDLNPLYHDDEHARNSRYGSIIAPPGFFGWPAKRTSAVLFSTELVGEVTDVLAKAGYPRGLDGGIEMEFFKPIRAGDKLAAASLCKDIVEREGKTGKFALVTYETVYINQDGEVAAKVVQTSIRR